MFKKVFLIQLLTIVSLAALVSSEHVFWQTFKERHRGPQVERSGPRAAAAVIEEKWLTQKVDHFNEQDTRTFQMRWYENAENYEIGGPLFILVAGEWVISDDVMEIGHVYQLSKEHKGLYIYLEHRFYGKSQPFSEFTTENLQYLDIKQILADIAHFITHIKTTYPGANNSKVFLGGAAYTAMLSVWLKYDRPELVDAIFASSAILINKFNFYEIKDYETDILRRVGGEECYNAIDNATRTYEQMFKENRGAEVRAMLKICNDFDERNQMDIWSFFASISDVFSGVMQTQNPQNQNIEKSCRMITSAETPAVGLAKFLLYIWTRIGRLRTCNQMSYATMVQGINYTQVSEYSIGRQWAYQMCAQIGGYAPSGTRKQPYGEFPEELYLQMCRDAYGPKLTKEYIYNSVSQLTEHYGDENIEVEHVYYTNGDCDPIIAMGIKDPARCTFLPGYSHNSDFESINSRDTPEMVASKQKLAQLVREWFAE